MHVLATVLNEGCVKCSYATTGQIHGITNIVERAYEENIICSAIFLDIAQAFDKV
jgi:aerobic-type carbon monoxide dehydrogenase small subunit (CoxS/CutS family)